jgi:hypothetical protein
MSPEMSQEKILSIATHQKNLLTCFALLMLFTVLALFTQAPAGQGFRIPVLAIYYLIAIYTVVWAFMLTNDVTGNVHIALVVALCLLIPAFYTLTGFPAGIYLVVNLLILMAVNVRAMRVLKDNGVPVGFSGADITTLKSRLGMRAADAETSPSKTTPSQ